MADKAQKNKEDVDLESLGIDIKVNAIVKYASNKPGHFLMVEFTDVDGEIRDLMIPATAVNNLKALKDLLIENCFPFALPKEAWVKIQEILYQGSDERMELVENPGFHNSVFLLPNNEIIGKLAEGQNRPVLNPSCNLKLPDVERKGSLNNWQSFIASSALNSSRIMLAITGAFSPYLLCLSGVESGGFHFFWKSSTGKTTCCNIALSVQSSPKGIESWSTTETGVEESAAGHNDQLLVFDELKNLDANPVVAAQKAAKIIYTISFEKNKQRSKNYAAGRLTWKTVIISSGEYSLTEHAAEGNVKRLLGEEVRLIDIPADAGKGLGIFERIPKSAKSAANYADDLKSNCGLYYGRPQQLFLRKFTAQMTSDSKGLKVKIESAMKAFMDQHGIDGSKGYESRMAKRFALAYAAGILAIEYEILPFTVEDVMTGISKCYVDTINNRKSNNELIQEAYQLVKNELAKTDNFLDICNKEHGFSLQQLQEANGYKTVIKNNPVRAITSHRLNSLIPDERILNDVLKIFIKEKRLLCDAQGKHTRPIISNMKSPKKLPRAYCFLPNPK